jgi:hypothetical protein
MTTKQWTLAGAIVSSLATVVLALTGVLPPVWAALTASTGAGAYALARTFQKRAAGETWKSIFSTTEARGAALAIVGSIVAALAKVLPPAYAGAAVAVAGALLELARRLQAGLPNGPSAPEASK